MKLHLKNDHQGHRERGGTDSQWRHLASNAQPWFTARAQDDDRGQTGQRADQVADGCVAKAGRSMKRIFCLQERSWPQAWI